MPDQQAPAKPAPRQHRRTRVVMWFAMAGVVATVAIAWAVDVREASLFLGVLLLVLGVIRWVSRAPGPYGISTRSRAFDVGVLLVGAAVVAGLGMFSPNL